MYWWEVLLEGWVLKVELEERLVLFIHGSFRFHSVFDCSLFWNEKLVVIDWKLKLNTCQSIICSSCKTNINVQYLLVHIAFLTTYIEPLFRDSKLDYTHTITIYRVDKFSNTNVILIWKSFGDFLCHHHIGIW